MRSVEEMNKTLDLAVDQLVKTYPQFDKASIIAKLADACQVQAGKKLQKDIETRVELMDGSDLLMLGKLCGKLKKDGSIKGILSLGSKPPKRAKGKSNGKTKRVKKQKQKASN